MTTTRRRTKGAGGVFKDSKGTWHFRREVEPDPATGARRYIESTGKVKAEARARFEAKVAEYERTGLIRSSNSPFVRDYAERWMAEHRNHIKPNSWQSENGWMRTMCERIGGLRLDELKPEHILKLERFLGRTRARSTVRCHLSVLSAMLKDAEYEGLIESNPMRHLRLPRARRRPRPILGPDEPARLISSTGSYESGSNGGNSDTPEMRDMWNLMFTLAFATGMRPGERYGLMPFQLERRNGVPGIFVCQQVQRYAGGVDAVIPDWLDATHLYGDRWLTTPKSERGNRFVPVSEKLWNRLWGHVAMWGIGPRQLMFANAWGRPLTFNVEKVRWRKCLAAGGLPDVDMYSARHWTSTMIGESGAADDERMLIMGHADIETTAMYTHWRPEALARTMSRAIPDLDDVS
ncbi:tyrosine-type recombinase/integrase [Bifidobacterium sp. SO4]|uniref:tyrosine-type recombinase/integrase n=1 Tax=Bifidobacterium sp. SO4 TaxID=2809030 RepID=UPI001BDD10C6|nr:tyrosine-type recombinase/integrase [Bifidobacterium sp. SO4]MBT1170116.1 tyrosine-type recombinase/integrase [Bifidobacterium sp. SO4]